MKDFGNDKKDGYRMARRREGFIGNV